MWPCSPQALTDQKRLHHGAAEYKGHCEEDKKYERERERVLNLQLSDAGRSNRSGHHFDIVTLAYQPSQGGRQLKDMVGNVVICVTELSA